MSLEAAAFGMHEIRGFALDQDESCVCKLDI